MEINFKAKIIRGVILPTIDLTEYNSDQIECKIIGPNINNRRSVDQNSYYFGVVIPIIQQNHLENTGELLTKEDIHAFNQVNIFGAKPKIVTIGERQVIYYDIQSSSSMSKKVFNNFIEEIIKYYAENEDLIIPEPNEKLGYDKNFYASSGNDRKKEKNSQPK